MSRTARRSAVTALVCVLVAALCACSGPSARSLLRSIDEGTVIIGVKADQPGLGLRGSDGDYSGFDIDVARYVVSTVAAARGKAAPRITWRETPSAQRERLIGNGEVDAVVASYSIDDTRLGEVGFAGPYLSTRQGLLVRQDATANDGAAPHGTVCSVTGSTSSRSIRELMPDVRLTERDTYSECVDALGKRAVDAVTTDEVILAGFVAQRPNEFRIVELTLPKDTCIDGRRRAAGTALVTERYGIGLAHGDDAARDAVNAALQQMIDTGEWERALRRAVGDAEFTRLRERDGAPPRVGELNPTTPTALPCATS